jgi:peptide/nickel transport system substrate-binding protein
MLGITMLLSACGKSQEKNLTDTNISLNQEQTKPEPKSLTFYAYPSDNYDPAINYTLDYATIGQSVFEGLVRYKKNSTEVEPSLATSWEINPEMKVYKFFLRKDVKFHDGSNFNADSVLYSFNRQLKENRTEDMSYASFIFDVVSKVEKLDDFTVQITLNEPSVTFLTNLAMYYGAPIISAQAHKEDVAAFAQKPVGTGPYKVSKHDKGEVMVLEINNDYWGEKPKVDEVSFLFEEKKFPDMINDFSKEKVDLVLLTNQADLNKFNPSTIQQAQFDSPDTYYLAFNCATEPFNNRNFREGVSRLINRDELIKTNVEVNGEKAETLIPTTILGYNSKVKAYDFDMAKATELLKDFPKDKELTIIYKYDSYESFANFVVESLKKAGINIKHELVEEESVFKDRLKTDNYNFVIDGWVTDNGDPDNFMFLLNTSSINEQINYSKFSNKIFDEKIAIGKKTIKTDERIKIYQEAEELISKEVPILPLFHSGTHYIYSTKLKNFHVHPTGVMLFQYFDKN